VQAKGRNVKAATSSFINPVISTLFPHILSSRR